MKQEKLRKPSNAAHKAAGERKVFQGFLNTLDWPSGSITSETPPAPDVLYKPFNGKPLAFELGELVDEAFAQAIKQLAQSESDITEQQANAELLIYSDFQNPLQSLLNKKLNKKYQSPYPIHLLMYWAGRSALFQKHDLNWIHALCKRQTTRHSPFESIWYWGEAGPPIQVWTQGCDSVNR